MFVSMGSFTDIIQRVADASAENGAEQSRLGMVGDLLIQNQTNLEAAHGRIMDADVALESSRFARQNVLVQSSAAMVAQANQLTNVAMQLLSISRHEKIIFNINPCYNNKKNNIKSKEG